MKVQIVNALIRGNGMSREPSMSGSMKIAIASSIGTANRNIIAVPCVVKSWLKVCSLSRSFSGIASCVRSATESNPLRVKKKKVEAMKTRPVKLLFTLRSFPTIPGGTSHARSSASLETVVKERPGPRSTVHQDDEAEQQHRHALDDADRDDRAERRVVPRAATLPHECPQRAARDQPDLRDEHEREHEDDDREEDHGGRSHASNSAAGSASIHARIRA